MFSFHKPKVYRSSTGCCICRAKSSSSRFTDSKKYEDDFMDCFQLHERRSGEICNACVLLVKRWKKLPPGSERNWHHVVDARAGPGTKSLTKFKSKNKKKLKLKPTDPIQKVEKLIKKKHIYLKNDRNGREQSPGENSDDMAGDDFMSDMGGHSIPSSPNPSEYIAPRTAAVKQRVKARSPHRHEKGTKRRMSLSPAVSSFLDMSYWKREKVCCGTIFKGPYGVVIVDPRFLKPCQGCRSPHVQQCNAPAAPRTPTTGADAGMHHPASGPEAGAAASASNGERKRDYKYMCLQRVTAISHCVQTEYLCWHMWERKRSSLEGKLTIISKNPFHYCLDKNCCGVPCLRLTFLCIHIRSTNVNLVKVDRNFLCCESIIGNTSRVVIFFKLWMRSCSFSVLVQYFMGDSPMSQLFQEIDFLNNSRFFVCLSPLVNLLGGGDSFIECCLLEFKDLMNGINRIFINCLLHISYSVENFCEFFYCGFLFSCLLICTDVMKFHKMHNKHYCKTLKFEFFFALCSMKITQSLFKTYIACFQNNKFCYVTIIVSSHFSVSTVYEANALIKVTIMKFNQLKLLQEVCDCKIIVLKLLRFLVTENSEKVSHISMFNYQKSSITSNYSTIFIRKQNLKNSITILNRFSLLSCLQSLGAYQLYKESCWALLKLNPCHLVEKAFIYFIYFMFNIYLNLHIETTMKVITVLCTVNVYDFLCVVELLPHAPFHNVMLHIYIIIDDYWNNFLCCFITILCVDFSSISASPIHTLWPLLYRLPGSCGHRIQALVGSLSVPEKLMNSSQLSLISDISSANLSAFTYGIVYSKVRDSTQYVIKGSVKIEECTKNAIETFACSFTTLPTLKTTALKFVETRLETF
ncbi:Uncharacterized protein GBIM_09606, partial [Gryllus bimaculatus]